MRATIRDLVVILLAFVVVGFVGVLSAHAEGVGGGHPGSRPPGTHSGPLHQGKGQAVKWPLSVTVPSTGAGG